MMPAIGELRPIITEAARTELLPRFGATARQKADGSLVTEADIAMQQRVAAALAERWPRIALLGEEMDVSEQQRLLDTAKEGLWLLDPLDGTTNFAMGLPFFSVSLALLADGEIQCGLVYDPLRDECFSAVRGGGAALNDAPLRDSAPGLPLENGVGAVDFKRLAPDLARRVASEPPFASQRNCGSAALDWCTLAAGRYHVYLHGRQKIWDYAAGSLILQEAGGHAATLEGERVFTPAMVPRSVVAGADRELFERWLTWVRNPSGWRLESNVRE